MGIYLNPSADGFMDILKDGFYVDKTGLITYTNQVMGTSRKLICFSRPRRFGKSYAAQMLVAFYSKGGRFQASVRRAESFPSAGRNQGTGGGGL